jgi:hypothetical protein
MVKASHKGGVDGRGVQGFLRFRQMKFSLCQTDP